MKDNAWFVGFAPQDSPEIVVVALFESGEHGNLAAPIVRDVIKAYFDKRVRQDPHNLLASLACFQARSHRAASWPSRTPKASGCAGQRCGAGVMEE